MVGNAPHLAAIDYRPHHPIFNLTGIEILKRKSPLCSQPRRLVNLDKKLRKRTAALFFRKTVVPAVALNQKLPRPIAV